MLELIVFFSGASIMVLEMVGSRVLAPYLGTSLIVWTSLIGIVLAFLAVGAWLGGKLADKYLSSKFLSLVLVAAGLCTSVTGLIHPIIGQMVSSTIDNIYLAVLLATILLLALPGLFFGMVSPYIIRLRLSDIESSGQTVGRLYALSTAGSILGTFLGGFVLISWFSTTQILFGIAIVMILLSILSFPQKVVARICMMLMLAGLGVAANYSFAQNAEIINTQYNSLVVMEGYLDTSDRQMRFLMTDPGSVQSGIFIDEPNELALSYTHFFKLGEHLKPNAKKVLMLGGGGYSYPRYLLTKNKNKDLQLDVLEIDAGITEVAKAKFGLPNDERLNIYHQDARIFINNNQEKYDIVLVDVFGSYYSIPFHMTTTQAMEKLSNATAENGIVIMNIISALTGEKSKVFAGIHRSLQEHFPKTYVYAVNSAKKADEVQNIMVLALKSENEELMAELAKKYPDAKGEAKTIVHMLARQVSEFNDNSILLTDEFAPIERYMMSL